MDTQTLARTALIEGDCTCAVAYENKVVFTSKERGVKPLVDYIRQHGEAHPGAAVADRVIGRAAALLLGLTAVTQVYGEVMSAGAKETLENRGVEARCDTLVDAIQNRTKTGLCPMESLSRGVEDPHEMLAKVEEFLKNLPKS